MKLLHVQSTCMSNFYAHHNGSRPHLAHEARPYKKTNKKKLHYSDLCSGVWCNWAWGNGKPVVTVVSLSVMNNMAWLIVKFVMKNFPIYVVTLWNVNICNFSEVEIRKTFHSVYMSTCLLLPVHWRSFCVIFQNFVKAQQLVKMAALQ